MTTVLGFIQVSEERPVNASFVTYALCFPTTHTRPHTRPHSLTYLTHPHSHRTALRLLRCLDGRRPCPAGDRRPLRPWLPRRLRGRRRSARLLVLSMGCPPEALALAEGGEAKERTEPTSPVGLFTRPAAILVCSSRLRPACSLRSAAMLVGSSTSCVRPDVHHVQPLVFNTPKHTFSRLSNSTGSLPPLCPRVSSATSSSKRRTTRTLRDSKRCSTPRAAWTRKT